MRRVYLLMAVAVLCLGAETAFAQSYVSAPASITGADNRDVDFGFIGTNFSIGNWVWYDSNNNGQQDGGEVGIGGVTVELWQGTTMINTTTTIEDSTPDKGNYIFTGLSNGEYEVRIPMPQSALEGMINTTPNVPPDDTIDSDGIPN